MCMQASDLRLHRRLHCTDDAAAAEGSCVQVCERMQGTAATVDAATAACPRTRHTHQQPQQPAGGLSSPCAMVGGLAGCWPRCTLAGASVSFARGTTLQGAAAIVRSPNHESRWRLHAVAEHHHACRQHHHACRQQQQQHFRKRVQHMAPFPACPVPLPQRASKQVKRWLGSNEGSLYGMIAASD